MDWYDLADELTPTLQKGDIDSCIKCVTEELKKLPDSPFTKVIELEFTNSPQDVAACFKNVLDQSNGRVDIKALYTETNGFDINPDEWYFDIFGYAQYGGLDDLDWLSDWQAESNDSWVLTGMETLQSVYASDAFGKPEFDASRELASLLVVLKYQKLIRNSMLAIQGLPCPVLATSHDYDFIYEHPAAN